MTGREATTPCGVRYGEKDDRNCGDRYRVWRLTVGVRISTTGTGIRFKKVEKQTIARMATGGQEARDSLIDCAQTSFTISKMEYWYIAEFVRLNGFRRALEFGPGLTTYALLENNCEVFALETEDEWYRRSQTRFKAPG